MQSLLPESLETERLRLRKPRRADARAIFAAYAQDAEVSRYLIWTPHASVAMTRTFVRDCIDAWEAGDVMPYVLASRASDEVLGMLEARLHGATTIDLGYVLARIHWRRGFMSEALTALSSAALSSPDIFRVQATCDVENIASARVLEKSGFKREGRLERYMILPNVSPEPRASFMYARWR